MPPASPAAGSETLPDVSGGEEFNKTPIPAPPPKTSRPPPPMTIAEEEGNAAGAARSSVPARRSSLPCTCSSR